MRLVAEGGVEAVKLEGGADYVDVIRRIVRAGVPVMGHIGLTPQSVHKMGGYVVQGKDAEKAQQLLRDARALEAAGCYAIVLECIPTELARIITSQLRIPTIGIGAGPHCDGQVLVFNDLLGLDAAFTPKFVKRFAELGTGRPRRGGRLRRRGEDPDASRTTRTASTPPRSGSCRRRRRTTTARSRRRRDGRPGLIRRRHPHESPPAPAPARRPRAHGAESKK